MIDLRIVDARRAVGWLEDDFHHFGVTIEHEGGRVVDVRMAAPRTPWSTCPGAAKPLQALLGKPLVARASDVGSLLDMRLQCTHVFDLAGLVLAHVANAGARQPRRRYHVVVSDLPRHGAENSPASFSRGEAWLYHDGELVLYWQIDGDRITGPEQYAGRSQTYGFRAWTESMPVQEAEYATVLRRAIMVAGGRSISHDVFPTAASMGMHGLCHTYQPQQLEHALRNDGGMRDFSDRPQDLLRNVDDIP